MATWRRFSPQQKYIPQETGILPKHDFLRDVLTPYMFNTISNNRLPDQKVYSSGLGPMIPHCKIAGAMLKYTKI